MTASRMWCEFEGQVALASPPMRFPGDVNGSSTEMIAHCIETVLPAP